MIILNAGDTKNIEVTVKENGNAVDLTGASIEFVIKKGSAVVTKTTSSGITITNALGGIYLVNLSPSDTQWLKGNYSYESKVTDLQGNVSTVVKGQMSIQ